MKKIIIGTLVVTVMILAGALLYVSNTQESKSTSQRTLPSSDSMMTNGDPTGSMEHMLCHRMGNGEWMGQCDLDANGNPKK